MPQDRAWYEGDDTEVEVISRGAYASMVRYTVEPGIAVELFVPNEDLVFEEEDNNDGV